MSKMETQISNNSQINSDFFQFERDFIERDQRLALQWMRENWTTSFYYAAAYLVFIYGGTKVMKNRTRFELRGPLALWSLGLALFSIIGTGRVFPELWKTLGKTDGIQKSICSISWSEDSSAIWVFLFAASKVIELGDTVFIVLRKQPLIFLHPYHHITVLIYCWYSYAEFIAPTRWFVSINFAIHSIMYSYYGLKALKFRIPKSVSLLITTLQITQMAIGMCVNIYAYLQKQAGEICHVSYLNIWLGFLMYTSYFVLFGNFFYKAYLSKADVPKGKKIK